MGMGTGTYGCEYLWVAQVTKPEWVGPAGLRYQWWMFYVTIIHCPNHWHYLTQPHPRIHQAVLCCVVGTETDSALRLEARVFGKATPCKEGRIAQDTSGILWFEICHLNLNAQMRISGLMPTVKQLWEI